MRKFFICTLLVLVTSKLFSQEVTPNQPLTREDYLKKSKSQRIAAWILLGGGATMIAIAAPGNVSFETAGVLAVGATACILGSIPLFIAAGRNRRKAAKLSTHLGIRQNSFLTRTGLTKYSVPTFSVKLNF